MDAAQLSEEQHPVLGRLQIVRQDGWTWIYHRTGKLLNYHKDRERADGGGETCVAHDPIVPRTS